MEGWKGKRRGGRGEGRGGVLAASGRGGKAKGREEKNGRETEEKRKGEGRKVGIVVKKGENWIRMIYGPNTS